MEKANLKKASIYYLIGNFFNKGITFLTVPIFTRILTTADYGIVTTYNSWATMLSMVMGCAIYMGIRSAFVDYNDVIDDFMSVTTSFTLACGFVITVLTITFSEIFNLQINTVIIFCCMIHSLGIALVQNYVMYLMMKYNYRFRTALLILPNLVSVPISIVFILFITKTNLYMGRIIPTAIINLMFGMGTAVLVFTKSKVIINKTYLKYALTVSLPLVLHGVALSILSQSDLSMLTWLSGASQAGIYSLIYNFSMLATVITTALDGVWVPLFTNKLKNKEYSSINELAGYYNLFMMFAMIGIILCGPEIVRVLASPKYWEGIAIIPPIVLANYLIYAYTLYVNIEHFHKKTIFVTVNTIIAAVSNLALNYCLIPKFGYHAAAYTTFISYVIAFILHAQYAKRLEPKLLPLRLFALPAITILLNVVIFYTFIDSLFIRWGAFVLNAVIIGYSNRGIIFDLIRKKG